MGQGGGSRWIRAALGGGETHPVSFGAGVSLRTLSGRNETGG